MVIGETTPETKPVFLERATETGAPIYFAEENDREDYPGVEYELKGIYQEKNKRTLFTALPLLKEAGYHIDEASVRKGFAHVVELTGLMGRWQKLHDRPTLVCDTGHNVGGISYVVEQLRQQSCHQLHIVIGMVNDKDISGVLALLPKEAKYYFTQASVSRALPAEQLMSMATEKGLRGKSYSNVKNAVKAAIKECLPEDFIFVGGSNFIVADLLASKVFLD